MVWILSLFCLPMLPRLRDRRKPAGVRRGWRVARGNPAGIVRANAALQRGSFHQANPAPGRIRMFLLHAFADFLIPQWKRTHRVKRGGEMRCLSQSWR